MPVKVAINGYGRIGRNILRALYEGKRRGEITIVAINDLGDAKTNAYLTRNDTAHYLVLREQHAPLPPVANPLLRTVLLVTVMLVADAPPPNPTSMPPPRCSATWRGLVCSSRPRAARCSSTNSAT